MIKRLDEPGEDAERWTVSRAATLGWDDAGRLTAGGGLSRIPFRLPGAAVALLDGFASPRALDEGVDAFLSRYRGEVSDVTRSRVSELVDELRDAALLIPDDGSPSLATRTYGRADIHVLMLGDLLRTFAYREALVRHAPGRVVLEIGCGSGALACIAARAGARRVYAVEESSIIDVARAVAERNGVADRITFVPGNSLDVELPEAVDLFYSELIGTHPLEENMLEFMADAVRRFVKPDGRVIPQALRIEAVGVDSGSLRGEAERLRARVEGAYAAVGAGQVDLEPLLDGWRSQLERRHATERRTARLGPAPGTREPAQDVVLTSSATVAELDLRRPDAPGLSTVPLELEALRDGAHNAMATSFTARLDETVTLSTSPYASQQPTNWGGPSLEPIRERPVVEGEPVLLEAVITPSRWPGLRYRRTPPMIASRLRSSSGPL